MHHEFGAEAPRLVVRRELGAPRQVPFLFGEASVNPFIPFALGWLPLTRESDFRRVALRHQPQAIAGAEPVGHPMVAFRIIIPFTVHQKAILVDSRLQC